MTIVPLRTQDDRSGSLDSVDSADSEAPADAEAPQLPIPQTSASTSAPAPAQGHAGPHRLSELDRLDKLDRRGGLPGPQLAIRSDAVVLVSMRDVARYDLSGRKRWLGIELTPQEAAEIRRRFRCAEEEAISHLGERLAKKKNSDS